MRGFNRSHRALTALVIFFIALMLLVPAAGAANGTTLPVDIQKSSDYVLNPNISKMTFNHYNVNLTVNKSSIEQGGLAGVTAKVTWTANGTTAPDVTVEFTCTPTTATLDPMASTTASLTIIGKIVKGQARSTFTSDTAGTYTIKAQAYSTYVFPGSSSNVKDDSATATIVVSGSSVTSTPTATPPVVVGVVTDTPTPIPGVVTITPVPGADPVSSLAPYFLYIVVGLVLLLVLLLLLLFLWLKSSLKVLPKKTRVPADGSSKLPIRVQFVNGLGMVKRMGRDTDVEIETTAGTIGSAVIPQGKDHVDVDLTSSKEFGPVTVTVRSGGKTATAQVGFSLEHGSLDVAVQPASIPADGASTAAVTVKIKDEKGNFVAPLEDQAITLKSTLGTIPQALKLPARAQSASATLTAGGASGTAVIVASLGNMHGEGKVELKGMPKRFCMHCGTPMSLEAAQCPKCGQTPPSGTDVKECPSCKTVIPEAARFCHHCGAMQPENKK